MLRELFGRRSAPGAQLAARAAAGLADPDEIALSCELLAGDLLEAVRLPHSAGT